MTNSLGYFLSASANVAALIALESSYTDPPNVAERAAVEGLRGGAVVILVAALESYVKDSVAEVLESINTASPPCDFSKLPPEIQMRAVYSGLEAAMKPKAWDPIQERQKRLPGVLIAVDRIHRREVLSAEIAQTAGNPNAAQLRSIYKIVGLNAIFAFVKDRFDKDWGTPTASTFIPDTLDKIVQMRHDVAHTASLHSIARTDILNWHKFMNSLVRVLDGTLERQIGRIIQRAQ